MGSNPTFGTNELGHSLTVERLTLDQVVGVRVPVPQPFVWQEPCAHLGDLAEVGLLYVDTIEVPCDSYHPMLQ